MGADRPRDLRAELDAAVKAHPFRSVAASLLIFVAGGALRAAEHLMCLPRGFVLRYRTEVRRRE